MGLYCLGFNLKLLEVNFNKYFLSFKVTFSNFFHTDSISMHLKIQFIFSKYYFLVDLFLIFLVNLFLIFFVNLFLIHFVKLFILFLVKLFGVVLNFYDVTFLRIEYFWNIFSYLMINLTFRPEMEFFHFKLSFILIQSFL